MSFDTLHPRGTRGRFTYKSVTESRDGMDTLSNPCTLEDLRMNTGDTVRMDRSDLGGIYTAFDRVDVTRTGDDAYYAEGHVSMGQTLDAVRMAAGVNDTDRAHWIAEHTTPIKALMQARYSTSHFVTDENGNVAAVFATDRHIYDHQTPEDIDAVLESDTGAGKMVLEMDEYDPDQMEGTVPAEFAKWLSAYDHINTITSEGELRRAVEANREYLTQHSSEMDEFAVKASRVTVKWCEERIARLRRTSRFAPPTE